MTLRISDRYLVGELFAPFCAWMTAFVIMIVGNFLFILLRAYPGQPLPSNEVVKFLAFKVPYAVVLSIPMSLLFATSLALNRLVRDGEISALKMGGLSAQRIMLPFIVCSVAMSLLSFVIYEKVVPWANLQAQSALGAMYRAYASILPKQQVFTSLDESTKLYIRQVDTEHNRMYDVMLFKVRADGFPEITTAKTATLRGDVWYLDNATVFVFDKNGFVKFSGKAKEVKIDFRQSGRNIWTPIKGPEEMTIAELREQIKTFRSLKLPAHVQVLELHTKFAIPAACLVFTLVAAPLTLRFGRGGSFMGILIAVAMIFVYYCFMAWGRILGQRGEINPVLGAWVQNIVFIVVGGVMWWRSE